MSEKARTARSVLLQSSQSIWIEFGVLLKLVGLMNLILILSCPINIQGREVDLDD